MCNRYFHSTNGEPTDWPTDSIELSDLIDFLYPIEYRQDMCILSLVYISQMIIPLSLPMPLITHAIMGMPFIF